MNATIPQATTAPLICETDETGFVTRVKLDGFTYVPEPVRCRDCAKSEEWQGYVLCHNFGRSIGAVWSVEPDGFCKWGERKGASA